MSSKMACRPKRHKLSTNSNPMASGEGIELSEATAFIVAEESAVNGGTHKRQQNTCGDEGEEETKSLKANVQVVEI